MIISQIHWTETLSESCKFSNIIYLIQCSLCGQQYVGETEQPLHPCMNNNCADITQKWITTKAVASLSVCLLSVCLSVHPLIGPDTLVACSDHQARRQKKHRGVSEMVTSGGVKLILRVF